MLLAVPACGDLGTSNGGPTAPSPSPQPSPPQPAGAPTVTIQLSYACNPCADDPDNYAINIDCVSGACAKAVRAQYPTITPNTLTASVELSPGTHTVEVVVHRPSAPVTLAFARAAGDANAGGVTPNSIAVASSVAGGVEQPSVSRCGVSTSFTTTPLTFTTSYTFGVMLGAAGSTC
jgi:hypothetical protein